jgi:hypothetical protein
VPFGEEIRDLEANRHRRTPPYIRGSLTEILNVSCEVRYAMEQIKEDANRQDIQESDIYPGASYQLQKEDSLNEPPGNCRAGRSMHYCPLCMKDR